MEIERTTFGTITIDGKTYEHDVIIRLSGEVARRKKKLFFTPITIDRAAALSRNCRLVGPVEMDTIYSLRDRGGCHARSTKRH
jgi:hypothetical protein